MDRIASVVPVGGDDLAVHHGARRASRRFPLHADVELLEPRPATGVSLNVSAGGLRVALDQSVAIGELCVLRVRTAADRETIEYARVVWMRELVDGFLVGLQFALPH